MNLKRRIAAICLAAVMVFALGACSGSDTTWAAEYKGEKIPAGVYLLCQLSAYTEAQTLVTDSSTDLLKAEIDGKSGETWIADRAMEIFNENLAISDKFDELGLSFTDEDIQTLDTYVEQIWTEYGESYEANGVAKSSVRYMNEITQKSNKIFEKIYGEGGEKAVSQEDLHTQYNKQYVKATYFLMSTTNMSDADKELLRTKANGYIERINTGEDMYDIIKEYEREITTEGTAIHCETAGENAHDLLDDSTNSQFPTGFHEEAAKYEVDQAFMIEQASYLLIAKKLDLNANPADFEGVERSVLYDLKSDDYEQYLKTITPTDTVVMNDAALSRYTVKKISSSMKTK